jgi:hypothetical protein
VHTASVRHDLVGMVAISLNVISKPSPAVSAVSAEAKNQGLYLIPRLSSLGSICITLPQGLHLFDLCFLLEIDRLAPVGCVRRLGGNA